MVVLTLLYALTVASWSTAAFAATAKPQDFVRGINMADFLAYPQYESWPFFRGVRAATTDEELSRLKSLGFTFVRLAVEFSPFVRGTDDQREQLDKRLASFVSRAGKAGLAVLVSGFAQEGIRGMTKADILSSTTGAAFKAYQAFLERLARTLAREQGTPLALELFNEPQPICVKHYSPDWMEVQRLLYQAVKAVDPLLTIAVTTGCWSSIEGLPMLDMSGYSDDTLVSLHFYEPFSFTHQGATWTLPELEALNGLSFPPDRTDRDAAESATKRLYGVRRQKVDLRNADLRMTLRKIASYMRENVGPPEIAQWMQRAVDWADRNHVSHDRLIISEFGALRPVRASGTLDDGSRGRWLAAVREAVEARGMGWALWAYHSEFGLLLNGEEGELDPEMVRALGLSYQN